MSKKLINLSNLQKFLLKLNEKFALKKAMKGISEDSEGNIIIGEEGLVPTPDENSKGKFLRSDGTWSVPSDSPLYESMSQEEGIAGVSEVDRVLNAKTLKAVIEENENVVHTSGNETISGTKTFTSGPWVENNQTTTGYYIKNTDLVRNEVPSQLYHATFRAHDKNGKILGEYCVEKSTTGCSLLNMNVHSEDAEGKHLSESLYLNMSNDGSEVRFYPSSNNKMDLGMSNRKWAKVYSDDVVHTSGNETIEGTKKFTADITRKYTAVDITTTPASDMFAHINFTDKNDKTVAYIQYAQKSYGVDHIGLRVRDKNSTTWGVHLNTDKEFVPLDDNSYSLGSANYKWAKIYSDDVVHTSGKETITGLKTFERNGNFINTKNSNVYLGCNPTSNQHQWINFLDKNDEQTGFISNCHYPGGANVIELYAQGKYKDGKPDPAGEKVSATFRVGVNGAGEKYIHTTAPWSCDFIPRVDNTYTLGNSSFKWKSIYGNLVGNADSSTMLTAQANSAMLTETTALPKVGMYHQKLYNDTGYPIKYGNLINVQSKDVGGSGQLLLGWSGTSGAIENIYYRNKRDTADAKWSEWRQIAYVEDLESKCLPLKGGTLNGKLTLNQSALAMSVKDTTSETIRTNDILFANSSNTEYGLNVGLGGCGATVVGAGESTSSQLAELEGKSEENLYLTSDVNIYFKVYANTYANAKTISLNKDAEMSGLSKVTSTSFVGALTGNADTATQFSANKSVTLTGDVTGTASSKGGWSVATTLANSGVTAGTYGPTANVTGNNNATISVPQITVDAKGRVTSVVNRTLTCKNNTYTVPTKVSQLTNDSKYVSLTALGSGATNGIQETEAGSIMLCVCNCSVLEQTSTSIQSNKNLQVPGSYLRPISWVESSSGLQRTASESSSYALPGTWRLLGNFQPSSITSKIYYVGLFMRVV